jgi:SAM-dependent methyltransferase
VDIIISNCVVNLSPDKRAVISGAYRALRPGGEFYFSDVQVFSDAIPVNQILMMML